CPFPELRQRLYREYRGEGKDLSEEDLYGMYVEPAVVRRSEVLRTIRRNAAEKVEVDSKAPMLPLETHSLEVKKRLDLYDRIRRGAGRFPGPSGCVPVRRERAVYRCVGGILRNC